MASTREIVLYVLVILLGWLSFLVVKPFLSFVILGFLFAFLFFPVYNILKKMLWDGLAAMIVVVIVLLCIILPSVYLAGAVISEATTAYQAVEASGVSIFDDTSLASGIERWTGLAIGDQLLGLFAQMRVVLREAVPSIITSTGVFLIGIFILFFVLYFALREGAGWFEQACSWLPVTKKKREHTMSLLRRQAKALLYGQILTSILVGILVGFFLWYFSVPNPVFWAFVTIIIGIIPVVGAFLVYIPAGIYLIFQGAWIQGIALMVLSTGAHLFIDNILRPKMVSKASEIHPSLVILGALGGIALMGIVGFLVGPLIISFFFVLMNESRTG